MSKAIDIAAINVIRENRPIANANEKGAMGKEKEKEKENENERRRREKEKEKEGNLLA